MAVWMVRAGRHGEREELALEKGLVLIGWEELPDLSTVKTREELEELCRRTYPEAKPMQLANWVGQIWAFRARIEAGDLVVLPLKSRSAIAFGRVKGPYEYRSQLPPDARHTRPVEWLNTDIARSSVDQDLLYSLGAFMTVCQIQRNNAEERLLALASGKTDKTESEVEAATDVAQYARDQIRDFIGQKFKGHELSRLVDEILKAQGYYTFRSPAGSDGGVDIIAGCGPMGFDPPRLCVQVKSSDVPVDIGVLRELQGSMKNFGGQQGLLVSWGGFKRSVYNEARRLFFEVRLWDSDDIVGALVKNYDNLSGDIQAEIPLKQIWVLVLEE